MADIGISVWTTYGRANGFQCQVIGAAGLGIQSVIDAGFTAAVDVWSCVQHGAQVCFEERGSRTILDARAAARAVTRIGHYLRDGKTCTWLTDHGSVALGPLRDVDLQTIPYGQTEERTRVSIAVCLE